MKKNAIYSYKINDKDLYNKIVEKAVQYSILSLPFTIDRMKITDEEQRILNIAKGKIAEELFKHFCYTHNIKVDFKTCETPFWQIDKRDFMLNGYEWDLKNNFIYYNKIHNEHILNLPALVPNRHHKDQWNSRNTKKIPLSKGVKYLFTFMKGANLIHKKRSPYFLEILLSNRQKQIIKSLSNQYKGIPTATAPFDPTLFWNDFLKDNKTLYKLNDMPELIITGYADEDNWQVFKDTGPYSKDNYINFITPYWYKKVGPKNSLTWNNGFIWTTITNKTAPIKLLKSFINEM